MRPLLLALATALGLAGALPDPAAAQIAPQDQKGPAKALFGAVRTPARLPPAALGSYAKGCLAGGVALPLDGPHWSVMRLSRERNWGHPRLIDFIARFSAQAPRFGLAGILVGDMNQRRGGPMLTGHASHQIGLDVDVWLRPMLPVRPTAREREDVSSFDVVEGRHKLDEALWPQTSRAMIRVAAEDPEVERIFVNPAIKRKLCEETHPQDRAWLAKVRPWWAHDAHFHVRLGCPADSPLCLRQAPVPVGDGCGADLDYWYTEGPYKPSDPDAPKIELTMEDLPPACRGVLAAP
ncbi:penicillin-insensitive murein endopeptidase [Neomegalonema sp.]|uniref:penicillin-insensitive murein endopeptidase n=1 Tax=Neomegalonema sp. TaxID=2039713 RepID=UPI0026042228|nr:penicillin-insensitive murein endopeptidase [Neomegalonema sp.]MDD2870307.1 penicillin-insensitive murein endopeptidase [Neomegalonema sp.]